MSRRALALLAVVALACAGVCPAAGRTPAVAQAGARARYIVELAAPAPQAAPGAAEAQAGAEARRDALALIAAITAAPAEPVYVYTRALNGFALELTPAQAAAVARLPGVLHVAPDWPYTIHTDASPAFLGAAQADLRPALFFATLTAAQAVPPSASGAAGRAVAHYDAAARALRFQIFYSGLSGPPTEAALRRGAPGVGGPLALDLAAAAVGAPDVSGGYVATRALSAADEAALFAGELYINIGSAAAPGGELRGQLGPSRGEGVVIGVLDTGIDPGHPAFTDQPADGYAYTNPLGRRLGVCSAADGDGRYDPSFACNDKLIGAYSFADTAGEPDPQGRPSPRDDSGHGSHVAGIAAGNLVPAAAIGGVALGAVAGVAPHANLVVYDVCGLAGNSRACSGAAILAAIDQAIADGVDLISLSLGGVSRDPWLAADTRGLLRAVGAGIFVAVSAGNGGPEPGSSGAPGNAPWVTSVGSVAQGRRPAISLRDFAGGDAGLRPAAPLAGLNVAGALGPTALVDAAALSPPNALCQALSAAQQGQIAGKIVVCTRSLQTPALTAASVQAAGGAGAVVVNNALYGATLDASTFPLPGLVLGASEGQALRAWLVGCGDCSAAISGFAREPDPAGADLVDETSARGPDLSVPDLLKPDLVGPGVDILAPGADVDPGAPDYLQLSGTSMATPHVSGLAALLRQIHPGWSPAEIRSAMALTGAPTRTAAGAAAGPFDQGGGRIRAGEAALAGFVLDIREAAYAAASPALGGDPSALNLPSLIDADCVGGCVFTRTLRSTLGVPVTWEVSASGDGFTVTTEPAGPLTLAPGATATIAIAAAVTSPRPGATGYGRVTFTARGGLAPTATMPVAIPLDRSNLPGQITLAARPAVGSQAIALRAIAIEDLAVAAYGLARLQPEQISLGVDPTPGDYNDLLAGGLYRQVLTLPAGNVRFRAELAQATAPDLDMLVYVDQAGVGFGTFGPEDSVLCERTGPGSAEACDLLAPSLLTGRPEAVQVTVLVQNRSGSGAERDSFQLRWGRVGAGAGSLAARGPKAVPAGRPFDLTLSWALPGARAGDRYIGVLSLGSTPATPADLGAALVDLEVGVGRSYLPLVGR